MDSRAGIAGNLLPSQTSGCPGKMAHQKDEPKGGTGDKSSGDNDHSDRVEMGLVNSPASPGWSQHRIARGPARVGMGVIAREVEAAALMPGQGAVDDQRRHEHEIAQLDQVAGYL
jgi:hypothetical protein